MNGSAPAKYYFDIDYKFKGKNGVEMIVNPARAFADKETLKSLYYLDDCIPFYAKDASGNPYHGFWGVVINDPNSYNYKHHNSDRMLEICVTNSSNTKIFFNDAGLNTKGDIVAEYADVQTFFANRIQVTSDMKASYHDPVTSYGFRFKKVGASTWLEQRYTVGDFPKNTAKTELILIQTDYQKDDQVILQPFIGNVEGDYHDDEFTITVLAPVFERSVNYRTTACGSGTNILVYMKEDTYQELSTVTTSDTVTEIFVYSNPDLTSAVSAGFYAGLYNPEPSRVYNVNSEGRVLSYTTCVDPVITRMQLTIGTNSGAIEVFGTISPVYGSNITITGHVAPYDESDNETFGGSNFTLNITAGASSGSVLTFTSATPGFTYKLSNIVVSPSDPDLTYQTSTLSI